MALCKLKLDSLDGAAGLAKYLLESLNDESRRGTLPNTFLDRLSFDEVMNKLIENREIKRACKDGGGGGCSGGCDPQDVQGEKSKDHHPPSGDSQVGPLGLHINGGEYHVAGTGDDASAVQFFALPSDTDSANELDLLDIADDAEQYEILLRPSLLRRLR